MGDYDVEQEVATLVVHLKRLAGSQSVVTFGTLFKDSEAEQAFESLVGTMLAAKKRGAIKFAGDFLLFPSHKDVVITIVEGYTPSAPAAGTAPTSSTRKEKREQFERQRAEFEKQMERDANEAWINTYHTEKLEAEMKFLEKKQSEFKNISSAPTPKPASTPTPKPSGLTKPMPEEVKKEVKKDPMPVQEVKKEDPPASGGNEEVVKAVQAIMNDVFKILKGCFPSEGTFESSLILDKTKETIVQTTLSCGTNAHTVTIKTILNDVFKQFRTEFTDGQEYSGTHVLNVVKKVIVSATNNLLQAQAPTPAPASKPAPAPAPAPTPSPAATKPVSKFQVKTASPTTVVKSTPAPAKAAEPEQAPQATPSVVATPPTASTPSTPVKKKTDTESPTLTHSPSTNTQSAAAMRQDAEKRIKKTLGPKDVDLTDPEVLDSYVRIRDPTDPLLWMILTYAGTNTLKVTAKGEGGFAEFMEFS